MKRHHHHATKEEKEMAVALTGGPKKHKPGPRPGCQPPHLDPALPVSDRTLRRWRSEARKTGKLHDPLPSGHRSQKLSEGEKRVVGGKVLDDCDTHQVVSCESLRAWILGAWNVSTSHGYIVKLMSDLHLSSKKVTERELKYFNPDLVDESFDFLTEVNQVLIDGLNASKLVAIDVCYWSNSRHVLRSYGPRGRYVVGLEPTSHVDLI